MSAKQFGEEPAPTGLTLVHEHDRSVRLSFDDVEIVRYVYRPWDPPLESPRPYFHPIRTLGGDVVSLYRPHDHVWHKGIAWSLSNVGSQNFWGGTTFTREHGYRQLDNDGSMRHDGFDGVSVHNGVATVDERLTWVTSHGEEWISERRQLTAEVLPDRSAWRLGFATSMTNTSGAMIPIGSPTTAGRDNAGYSGFFWRGPRSFTGGTMMMADAEGGDELMGARGPWLAYVGRHDGHGRTSTLVFRDHPENFAFPNQWFVRANPFAAVCPAPFFSSEYELADGDTLHLRYDVFVADGALDAETCGKLAAW